MNIRTSKKNVQLHLGTADNTDVAAHLLVAISDSKAISRRVVDVEAPVGFLKATAFVDDANVQRFPLLIPIFHARLGGYYSPLDASPQAVVDLLMSIEEFAASVDLPKRSQGLVDNVLAAITDERGDFALQPVKLAPLVTGGVQSLSVIVTVDDVVGIDDEKLCDSILDYHKSKYRGDVSLIGAHLMNNPKVTDVLSRAFSKGTRPSSDPHNVPRISFP